MEPSQIQSYVFLAAIVAFFGFRWFRFKSTKSKLPDLLASGGVVVDVRSPAEFASGSRPGSVNIPLGELESSLSKLDRKKPVIVCCASGTRSGMAASLLKRHGFERVVNAGPWGNTLG